MMSHRTSIFHIILPFCLDIKVPVETGDFQHFSLQMTSFTHFNYSVYYVHLITDMAEYLEIQQAVHDYILNSLKVHILQQY